MTSSCSARLRRHRARSTGRMSAIATPSMAAFPCGGCRMLPASRPWPRWPGRDGRATSRARRPRVEGHRVPSPVTCAPARLQCSRGREREATVRRPGHPDLGRRWSSRHRRRRSREPRCRRDTHSRRQFPSEPGLSIDGVHPDRAPKAGAAVAAHRDEHIELPFGVTLRRRPPRSPQRGGPRRLARAVRHANRGLLAPVASMGGAAQSDGGESGGDERDAHVPVA